MRRAMLLLLLLLLVIGVAWPSRAVIAKRPGRELAARQLFIPAPPKWQITRGDTTLPDGQLGTGGWSDGATGEIRLPERIAGEKIGRPEVFAAAHEIAHSLDAQSLDDPWRRRFQAVMGAPEGAWRTGTGPAGKKSPSEWFGDYYGASVIRMRPTEGMGTYVDDIDPRRLRRFRRALSEFAATKPELQPLRRAVIRQQLGA